MTGKVFRYVTETELWFMQNEPEKLGNCFSGKNSNTFIYKKGRKYLHFFKNKNSIKLVKGLYKRKINQKFYICTFEIPFSKLIFHCGMGYYFGSGFEDYNRAIEFAIPAEQFEKSWLVSVEEEKE